MVVRKSDTPLDQVTGAVQIARVTMRVRSDAPGGMVASVWSSLIHLLSYELYANLRTFVI